MEENYLFLSKALLTEEALDKAGRKNGKRLSQKSDEEIYERLCIDKMDETMVETAEKMAKVYIAICAFENGVRSFIQKYLLEKFEENWWELGIPPKIRTRAETRKDEEDKIKWHSNRGTENLLSYTEFGDLISVMFQNWDLFEPHINNIEWARAIIKSLERSRNVIMHSGELSNEDIERVGMYIRDWIQQVGA